MYKFRTTENFARDKQGNIISHPWWIKWDGDAHFSHIQATGGTVGGWTIEKDYLKAGNIELKKEGSISATDGTWWISKDGVANFQRLQGVIYPGTVLKGNGFTLGGGGGANGTASGGGGSNPSGTSLNPSVIGCPPLASLGGRGTLGGELKVQFDTLYAKKAQIDELTVVKKFQFQTNQAEWHRGLETFGIDSVTRNSSGAITGFKVTYHFRTYLCALASGTQAQGGPVL